MHQDSTWYGGWPHPRGLCVLWGPSHPFPKGAEPPIFGPCLLRPNGCVDQDATRYGGRPQPRRLCIRWGPSFPFPKRGQSHSQFSAHVHCGQTAGWIKMILGTEVGLGPRHIVLDGDWGPSSPPQKGSRAAPPPIFGPFLLWPNGWMRQDATWYGGRPRLSRLCVRWGSSYPQKKVAHASPPNFRLMSIVAKRLNG